MIKLEDLNTELYEICHLSKYDTKGIDEFRINRPEGTGLEVYLKHAALVEENEGTSRTYLIKDKNSEQIVAYFTLRTGLITVRASFFSFDNYTGIELSNFAVNDAYREHNDVLPQLGSYIFQTFILPLVREINIYIGATFLYIFALPHNKLMNHYRTIGFQTASRKVSNFLYRHVKPAYDKRCIFMYLKI